MQCNVASCAKSAALLINTMASEDDDGRPLSHNEWQSELAKSFEKMESSVAKLATVRVHSSAIEK